MQFPYNRFLVEALKLRIPRAHRRYDPLAGKSWTITGEYANVAAKLLETYFPDARFLDADESWNDSSAPPSEPPRDDFAVCPGCRSRPRLSVCDHRI
jgi:hypothetical protein